MPLATWDDVYILAGPTASGKTAAGAVLAERLGAEIVSLDSIAVYRGMDIGTAKPSPAEQARVPHHLIDAREPWEQATVAWWSAAAAKTAAEIRERGKKILLVGGTPLYLKALLRGLFEAPPADPELRLRLDELDTEEIRRRLAAADPFSHAKLHPNDRRRLQRALEVFVQTGKAMSAWQTQFDRPANLPRPGLWLDWPRARLRERIGLRVEQMLAQGLFEECRRLAALPRPLCKEARQAAGYFELFEVLAGRLTLEEAVPLIQNRTRQLAKRQITWCRHLEELEPLPMQDEPAERTAERALARWGIAP